MNREEKLAILVHLGEVSRLKSDLNTAVAALFKAPDSHFRPHVGLNGIEGVGVLKKIEVDSDTEFWMRPHLIVSLHDVWLNVKFGVFLDEMTWPTHVADLSPRQSAYVIQSLPLESRAVVLARVKRWYLERFLPDIENGLASITEQFSSGDPLLASDYRNRIFDIHGERSVDVPYTEWEVVGENLFGPVFYGGTFLEYGQDGYERADRFIVGVRARQKAAVDGFLGLVRVLR